MRFLTLICLAVFFSGITHAQQDTAFFDVSWKELPGRKDAAYFRPMPKAERDKYRLVDYYISGKMMMTGYYDTDNIESPVDFNNRTQNRDGLFEYYNKNGAKEKTVEYAEGEKHGVYKTYDSTGMVLEEGVYRTGHMYGLWKLYYYDGTLWAESNYLDDSLDGPLKSYYKDGKLKRDAIYEHGKLVKGIMYDQKGKEIPYTRFRVSPKPNFDLQEYLSKNIIYPGKARRKNIEGKVIIGFVTTCKGYVSKPRVVKSAHELLDAEAMRAVMEMPRWHPGMVDDDPVDVHHELPFTFRLED